MPMVYITFLHIFVVLFQGQALHFKEEMTSIILSRRFQFLFTSSIHLVLLAIFCSKIRLSTLILCWKSTGAALASLYVLLFSWAEVLSVCFFQVLKPFKAKLLPLHGRNWSRRDVEPVNGKQGTKNTVSCDNE